MYYIVTTIFFCCTIIEIRNTKVEVKNNFPMIDTSNDLCRELYHYRQGKNKSNNELKMKEFSCFSSLLKSFCTHKQLHKLG